jgi:hypothetical protein
VKSLTRAQKEALLARVPSRRRRRRG